MPDNGTRQLQTQSGERICEIVTASDALERTKIAQKLYGGQYLIQTVGTPVAVKNVTLRAWSAEEQAAVNAAEATGALVVARLGEELTLVQILDAPSWNTIVDGKIFETGAKLVVMR